MIYAFQDQDYLYLVMDLLTGGNLRYHLTRHKKFNEEQSSTNDNSENNNGGSE